MNMKIYLHFIFSEEILATCNTNLSGSMHILHWKSRWSSSKVTPWWDFSMWRRIWSTVTAWNTLLHSLHISAVRFDGIFTLRHSSLFL